MKVTVEYHAAGKVLAREFKGVGTIEAANGFLTLRGSDASETFAPGAWISFREAQDDDPATR